MLFISKCRLLLFRFSRLFTDSADSSGGHDSQHKIFGIFQLEENGNSELETHRRVISKVVNHNDQTNDHNRHWLDKPGGLVHARLPAEVNPVHLLF